MPRINPDRSLEGRDEAGTPVTLYGQEKDAATSGLARMNMILHDNPTALVVQGKTLADPRFRDGDNLKTFDFVVANPIVSRGSIDGVMSRVWIDGREGA